MNIFKKIINLLERRRNLFGYSQQNTLKLVEITQFQYSRIEKGSINHNKNIKNIKNII